jgi:hypothetical protein
MTEVAPKPLLWLLHQFPLHWIAMHIPQLLRSFTLRVNIKIVEAWLPHWHGSGLLMQTLILLVASATWHNSLGKTLLHALHYRGRISDLRLAHQQVEMLWHYHVTQYHEAMLVPHLFENPQEQIALPICAEPALSLVTAASNVMQVSASVVSLEPLWHLAMLRGKTSEGCDG